jgi:hypothetical protein
MTLTKKLMRIVELVHSDGGITFLKIRIMLEQIQDARDNGSVQAEEFEQALDRVLRLCEYAEKQSFE